MVWELEHVSRDVGDQPLIVAKIMSLQLSFLKMSRPTHTAPLKAILRIHTLHKEKLSNFTFVSKIFYLNKEKSR